MDIVDFNPTHMPANAADFAALFLDKPKFLTDEVQSAVIKAYASTPKVRALIGAENDADAIEGSLKDNTDEVVTIIRDYARKNEGEFTLIEQANRRQLRHAYGVIRRRIYSRLAANNALSHEIKPTAQ